MTDKHEYRPPTEDERLGMEWWNALSRHQRAHWLTEATLRDRAGPASAADAWAEYKRQREDMDVR